MEPGPGRPRGMARRRRLLGYFLASALVLFVVVVAACGASILARACFLLTVWTLPALTRAPNDIVQALESSGPVFIKLAQWLSTRRDILSDELCDGMMRLHETVSVLPAASDRRAIFKAAPDVELGDILGGGCIAQVYSGRLLEDGASEPTEVAIKVRRPEVKQRLETDMVLLTWAAQVAELLRPELKWLALRSAVDNFGWYLQQQTNLTIEASHLRRLSDDFRGGRVRDGRLRVPRVVMESDNVMVTTVARGKSLTRFIQDTSQDESAKTVRKHVFHAMTDAMARMILKTTFIHGDLHPGNLFVYVPEGSDVPEITLIDAGIAIEMSRDLADMARHAAKAAIFKNPMALGKAVIGLHKGEGLCDFANDVEELERKVGYLLLAGCFMCEKDIWGETFEKYEDYRGSRVSEYFSLLLDHLSNHKVRVSPSLWSLMTAFALIEGSVQELGHGVNVIRSATPYLFNPWDLAGKFNVWKTNTESEAKHRR